MPATPRKGRRLGGGAAHQKAMLGNLVASLIAADPRWIITTEAKAKAMRPVAEKLITNLNEPADKPLHELLSDREHEVMRMIAAGVPLTDIGERLHVSVKTISSYRARIMEKMQMKSNAELTRYSMTHGLID